MEPLSWATWKIIRERGGLDYLLARTQLGAVSRLDRALLESTTWSSPPRWPSGRSRSASSTPAATTRWTTSAARPLHPYTASYNVTGQPAISVPLFHGDDGLPLAVQLGGRPADEATCSQLGAQLEAARPWADRRPELATA